MNFTAPLHCILLALHTPLSKTFPLEPSRSLLPSEHSKKSRHALPSTAVGVTAGSPWLALLLALALSGCDEHLSSGAPVVEMSYHDGGIVCFVAAHNHVPVGISCVRTEVAR